jgi:hypothetical protein
MTEDPAIQNVSKIEITSNVPATETHNSEDGSVERFVNGLWPEGRQSIRFSGPEMIHIQGNPEHIWFDGIHLVEADSRRAEPGKYYLDQTGETSLYRVEEVIETENHDKSYETPDVINDVENPEDELKLEHCYTLSMRDEGPYEGRIQSLPRYMFETETPPGMGNLPYKTFREV